MLNRYSYILAPVPDNLPTIFFHTKRSPYILPPFRDNLPRYKGARTYWGIFTSDNFSHTKKVHFFGFG